MRSKLYSFKGTKCGIRVPRNLSDWRDDFNKRFKILACGHSTPCWIWGLKKKTESYGQTKLNKKPIPAHRLSWLLHRGPIPKNLWVLHKCDRRRCVNPDHLFLGTAQDNMDDMILKGRAIHPRGENSSAARLSTPDVIEIRKLLSDTRLPCHAIAKKFNVSENAIISIYNGKSWSHLGKFNPIKRPAGITQKKLSPEKVLEIKRLLEQGESQSTISRKFGINQSHVSRIKHGLACLSYFRPPVRLAASV